MGSVNEGTAVLLPEEGAAKVGPKYSDAPSVVTSKHESTSPSSVFWNIGHALFQNFSQFI